MDTYALSPERAFERLHRLELQESNLRVGLHNPELEEDVRERLLRILDQITDEREQLIRIVVACNGGTIGQS